MSQTTLCRNFGGKEGGGRTFEGGVLAGHYGTNSRFNFTGSAVTFIQTSQLERFGGDVRRLCTLYVAN